LCPMVLNFVAFGGKQRDISVTFSGDDDVTMKRLSNRKHSWLPNLMGSEKDLREAAAAGGKSRPPPVYTHQLRTR
jgi:hypothetical protein